MKFIFKKKLCIGAALLCLAVCSFFTGCTSQITLELKKDGSVDVIFDGSAGKAFASLINATTGNTAQSDSVIFDTKEIEYEMAGNGFSNVKAVAQNGANLSVSMTDKNGKSTFETSVATNTGLQEVPDETLLRKAEAKYEADMRKIDAKDRKYDQDLAAIDNERNAIKSEMETLKTVAKDNVERTFKLFS